MLFGLEHPAERAGGAVRQLPVAHAHMSAEAAEGGGDSAAAATTTEWRSKGGTVESTFYGVLIARL